MRYFKMPEFACPCCGEGFDHMSQEYRCEKHNADVGGVRAFSVEKYRITPRDLWILKPWLAR